MRPQFLVAMCLLAGAAGCAHSTEAGLVDGGGDALAGDAGGASDADGGACRNAAPRGAWRPLSAIREPTRRNGAAGVWTGHEMLVWGGSDLALGVPTNTGGRYDPVSDVWTPTTTAGAPPPRGVPSAVWTGSEMLVWGGSDVLDARGPSPHIRAWGDGGRYDPVLDRWQPISTVGAPQARFQHTAVWTGREMIIWGGSPDGYDGGPLGTGGRYDPATDTWRAVSMEGAPSRRVGHGAVWTGDRMVVWGGTGPTPAGFADFNEAAAYDPILDRWTALTMEGAPTPRVPWRIAWVADGLFVWGGGGAIQDGSGGWLAPDGTWRATTACGAPSARWAHMIVSTGDSAIVWGGWRNEDSPACQTRPGIPPAVVTLEDGAIFDPRAGAWIPISSSGAPRGLLPDLAVWTGEEMIVWSGQSTSSDGDSGGVYRY